MPSVLLSSFNKQVRYVGLSPAKTRVDRAPRKAGIHPLSPGTLGTAAQVGTHGAPVSLEEIPRSPRDARLCSGLTDVELSCVAFRERQYSREYVSRSSSPCRCRPMSAGAQFAGLLLRQRRETASIAAAKSRSPLNLSVIEAMSTGPRRRIHLRRRFRESTDRES